MPKIYISEEYLIFKEDAPSNLEVPFGKRSAFYTENSDHFTIQDSKSKESRTIPKSRVSEYTDESGSEQFDTASLRTLLRQSTNFNTPQEGGVAPESERYVFITQDNYNVTLEQLYQGITFVATVATGQNWVVNLPNSSTVRDDGRIYKCRFVIVGESNESLSIRVSGGEVFTKGMTTIKLYRNINDDVIVGVLNNAATQIRGWQREGSNEVKCSVSNGGPLNIDASTFTEIPFTSADVETNESISRWQASNPNYVESLIRQNCRIDYKISIDATQGGGTWTFRSKLRIDRLQSGGGYVSEDIESSRTSTGNFGSEDQLINGYDDVQLNAGDRVKLVYEETNLSGNFNFIKMTVTSQV